VVVPDGEHSSFRSELAGIYGGLQFVDSLGNTSYPSEVRVICDGLSALQSSFGVSPSQAGQSILDILQLIRQVRASILAKGIRISPIHAHGHADESEVATAHTFEESLNIAMDARAKNYWLKMNTSGWPQDPLKGICVLRWEKRVVEVKDLGFRISSSALKSYWLKSKFIPATTDVDWAAFSKATRLVRRGKGVFMTKFFSGICGVNQWRRRRGITQSEHCPRCERETETADHLWDCGHSEAALLRQRHLDELIQLISD